MSTRRLVVVSAGLSQPSSTRMLADRLAAASAGALRERGVDATVEVVELREHARDLANNLLTGFPSGDLRAAVDAVAGADALIAVTPIFNASYSGLFKLFFDVLGDEALVGTPVLVGATGGTARHSLALEHVVRPMFAYLRSVVVPTAVYAASEDWGSGGDGGTAGGAMTERVDRAAAELAALVAGSSQQQPEDRFEDPTPFEDLLYTR